MHDTRDKVEKWRARAEELRALAGDFRFPAARESILSTARTYEQMADNLERRRNGKATEPKSG